MIEGWGCPRCGRVDAPQPCLGICVRRPGLVADVSEYREYAAHAQRMAETDRTLSAFGHVVGGVHPRPGREQQTVESLRSRARELLERTAAAPDLVGRGARADLDHAQLRRHERHEAHASSGHRAAGPADSQVVAQTTDWRSRASSWNGQWRSRISAPPAASSGGTRRRRASAPRARPRARPSRPPPRRDRPRPEPASGLLGRGLRIVAVVQVGGEDRAARPPDPAHGRRRPAAPVGGPLAGCSTTSRAPRTRCWPPNSSRRST